ISNHNDFDPLRLHPGVNLQFIGPDQSIPAADLIILPGSKSTRTDLAWLHAQGWAHAIRKHLRYGGKVFGICGGFQMLGERVDDPAGLEGSSGVTAGLGLLAMTTTMVAGKQLKNVRGTLSLPARNCGQPEVRFSGYEMHNGVSEGAALARPLGRMNGKNEGAVSADDQVAGTYVHGMFDEPGACEALLQWAGLDRSGAAVDYQQHRLAQLDRLADQVEQHLDTDWLRDVLGLKALATAPGRRGSHE
ncbi:MAG TPA: cobyric acid synthase CobQ, partial [Marinobacter sp.]|nr:cobyric acid synthase CobQ [Marinobacter sp.]